jgi:hypothetical protein
MTLSSPLFIKAVSVIAKQQVSLANVLASSKEKKKKGPTGMFFPFVLLYPFS